METMKGFMDFGFRPVLILVALFIAASVDAADNPAALALVKEGNRYVGEQAKDKVVQIRSEKSVGTLIPNIWYVVYYDPTATFKSVEVKFGAGKMLDVKRPFRVLELAKDASKTIDLGKVKTDSDKAIDLASKDALLEKLTLTSTSVKLENSPGGAMWKVRVWASKLRKPTEQVDLGEIWVSAEDGKVVKSDVHPNRVD
jgi:hypothetical protein